MSTATSVTERRGLLDRILGRHARADATAAASASDPSEAGAADDAAEAPFSSRAADPNRPRTRHTWPTLLARVRDVTKATAVVATDDQGLVVASTGDLPDSEMDAIAAHVSLAFDLFERLATLGTKTESVCAQYAPDGTWLTAIRMHPPVGPRMTIGIVGRYTLIREDRRRVHDAFMKLFDRPDGE